MTRVTALLATLTLALAVLLRSPLEYRIVVCVIVSTATIILAVRSLLSGKLAWAIVFLAVVGMFTPFQIHRVSHELVALVDMATLALFAGSPMIFRKPAPAVTPRQGS